MYEIYRNNFQRSDYYFDIFCDSGNDYWTFSWCDFSSIYFETDLSR